MFLIVYKEDLMKRLPKKIIVLLIMLISLSTVYTQVTDITPDELIGAFNEFSEEVANSLAFNSTVGLNWSDAYIGKFPNFGFGVTIGATTIPFEATDPITDLMNVDLRSQFPSFFSDIGFPFPAYTIDVRVGGFGIPFDMGFKLGMLPDDAKGTIQEELGLDLEYLLVGGDVRFALLENKGFRPDLSVGGGIYFLKNAYTIPDLMGEGETIEIANVGGIYDINLDNPDLNLEMKCWTIDTKVQASWKLFIIEPYLGLGASYARAYAGGGLLTEGLSVYDNLFGVTYDYDNLPPAIRSIIEGELGDLNPDGLDFGSDANGWSFRTFGGIALKIAVLYIDLNAMYNFTSKSIGASASIRLQFNFHGKSRKDDESDENDEGAEE
jgi:hypothetical protein